MKDFLLSRKFRYSGPALSLARPAAALTRGANANYPAYQRIPIIL